MVLCVLVLACCNKTEDVNVLVGACVFDVVDVFVATCMLVIVGMLEVVDGGLCVNGS